MEELMSQSSNRPSIRAAVHYRDPMTALQWLEKAFGFERSMVIIDRDGKFAHSQMQVGDGTIMVGGEWADFVASPASIGGKNTQLLHVHIENGIDAHCERARAAGATILAEPEEQFYGDRTYRARDLEGHVWVFGQTVRQVTREEAEKATGFKIEGWA
jgi:uncharacterized glyoxalase superfamily protein PhnB